MPANREPAMPRLHPARVRTLLLHAPALLLALAALAGCASTAAPVHAGAAGEAAQGAPAVSATAAQAGSAPSPGADPRAPAAQAARPIALVIHGGAGTMRRDAMDADQEQAVRAARGAALDAGQAVLVSGGSALDAATAAVVLLEDSPLFNAGKGA